MNTFINLSELQMFLSSLNFEFKFLEVKETGTIALISKGNSESILKIKPIQKLKIISKEEKNLKSLHHPNIISLKGSFNNEKFAFLELEKVEGVNLCDYLLSKGKLSETECCHIFKQMVSALSYLLFEKRQVHLDLKPDNFVYNPQTGLVKLLDFEHSIKVNLKTQKLFQKLKLPGTNTKKVGTSEYLSPEVKRNLYFGPEADVWSLGVTIFALLTGYFFDSHQPTLVQEFISNSNFSEQLKDLLSKILDQNPKKRITLQKILKHEWLLFTIIKI